MSVAKIVNTKISPREDSIQSIFKNIFNNNLETTNNIITNGGKFSRQSNITLNDNILSRYEINFAIRFNPDQFIRYQNAYNNIIFKKNINDARRTYINFTVGSHYETKKEIPLIRNFSSVDAFKSTFNLEYNFLIKNYEDYISSSNINELNLPNFYKTVNEELIKTPNTPFDGVSFFEIDLGQKYPIGPIKEENRKIFYDSSIIGSFTNLSTEEVNRVEASGKFSNYLKKFNPFKEQFPFYADITFDNSEIPRQNVTFNSIFTEFSLYKKIFNYFDLSSSISPRGLFSQEIQSANDSSTTDTKRIRYVEMEPVFKEIIQQNQVGVNTVLFSTKIQELVQKNELDVFKILNNSFSYSEVVGYKIQKFDTFGNSPTPLQEFYIPNTQEEKINFIDSQVKYNKRYRYKLSLLVSVIGAEYNFYPRVINNALSFYILNFDYLPKVYLFEIESSMYENFLLDTPPLEPEAEVISFIGVKNKIKFNLNTSVGRKEAVPITFNDLELLEIQKLAESQDRTTDKIIFQSDEPSDFFEMYRLETKPKNFLDFIGSRKTIIENNDSSAGSFEDTIVANKKYYYTFRSIDYHKHISNPSPIYEVEIVDDGGTIYPLIKVNEIEIDPILTDSKGFKRYMSIAPSLANTLISLEKNNNFNGLTTKETVLNSATIGLVSDGTWNKKFKVTVTSKTTGRKFDINLYFDIKKKVQ